jgi:hypothetical protein
MNEMKGKLNYILNSNIFFLLEVLKKMEKTGIETIRVNEVASTLLELGLQKDDTTIIKLVKKTLKIQTMGSGWIGIGETINSLKLLSFYRNRHMKQIEDAIDWYYSCQNADGGLGRFKEDRSRIPVCWRVLESLYYDKIEINDRIMQIIKWMETEWKKDMIRGGLSYKCAGILIANHYYPYFSEKFIKRTLEWLLKDQNYDGGWGPKKGAPVGSVPSYTGLALRAVLYHGDAKSRNVGKSINNGIRWIIINRLKNGLWKEHPAEKALIEISLFLDKYLKNSPNL